MVQLHLLLSCCPSLPPFMVDHRQKLFRLFKWASGHDVACRAFPCHVGPTICCSCACTAVGCCIYTVLGGPSFWAAHRPCPRKVKREPYKLVDLKYRFVGESFELEFWHTYYQHKYDFMKKKLWQKKSPQSLGGWQS